jgi:hypothetical protein
MDRAQYSAARSIAQYSAARSMYWHSTAPPDPSPRPSSARPKLLPSHRGSGDTCLRLLDLQHQVPCVCVRAHAYVHACVRLPAPAGSRAPGAMCVLACKCACVCGRVCACLPLQDLEHQVQAFGLSHHLRRQQLRPALPWGVPDVPRSLGGPARRRQKAVNGGGGWQSTAAVSAFDVVRGFVRTLNEEMKANCQC